ncbi:hypothetical protein JCM12856_18540 [Spirochaeta dissipatitropha]
MHAEFIMVANQKITRHYEHILMDYSAAMCFQEPDQPDSTAAIRPDLPAA